MRLIASLAVVVGLMLLLARFVGKRYGARAGAPVQVLHRQPLSRSASVSVISIGGRVLVVGTTDHQVSLLTELDPEDLVVDGELDATLDDRLGEELAMPGAEEPTRFPTPAPAARPAAFAALPTALRPAGVHRAAHRAEAPRHGTDAGGLTGSVLSVQTWRQAIAAATGKAS